MPVSKARRNRRTFRDDPTRFLPGPQDRDAVIARGVRLASLWGTRFAEASPTEVAAVLFDGWTLLGHRRTEAAAIGVHHTYVYGLGRRCVGFSVRVEAAAFPPPQDGLAAHDYIRLLDEAWSLGRERPWPDLTGPERVRRVLIALRDAIVGEHAVEFLAAASAELQQATTLRPVQVGPLQAMADVLLTEDLPDPDGQIAAARTLAGLRGFPGLP